METVKSEMRRYHGSRFAAAPCNAVAGVSFGAESYLICFQRLLEPRHGVYTVYFLEVEIGPAHDVVA